MSSRKTSVVIDEDLLAAVQTVLETKTVKDTIQHAFLGDPSGQGEGGRGESVVDLERDGPR